MSVVRVWLLVLVRVRVRMQVLVMSPVLFLSLWLKGVLWLKGSGLLIVLLTSKMATAVVYCHTADSPQH
jgi:hypothetical protein